MDQQQKKRWKKFQGICEAIPITRLLLESDEELALPASDMEERKNIEAIRVGALDALASAVAVCWSRSMRNGQQMEFSKETILSISSKNLGCYLSRDST